MCATLPADVVSIATNEIWAEQLIGGVNCSRSHGHALYECVDCIVTGSFPAVTTRPCSAPMPHLAI